MRDKSRDQTSDRARFLEAVERHLAPGIEVPEPATDPSGAPVTGRLDEFNAASERYFAELPHPEDLLGKPWNESFEFPRYLFNLGVMTHWGRMAPGHRVLEIGAGTCWVSHFLNRWGCRTVAVDVSRTALDLGEEVFRRDSLTRWELEPEFLAYDGHELPLDEESCDRIVLHDAFHHIPNRHY